MHNVIVHDLGERHQGLLRRRDRAPPSDCVQHVVYAHAHQQPRRAPDGASLVRVTVRVRVRVRVRVTADFRVRVGVRVRVRVRGAQG